MLAIVFTILKVIGWILLILLLFLLTVIVLLLFVPVRYRVSGGKYEDLTADANVSWLLRLVQAIVSYDSKRTDAPLLYCVKVLGKTVYSNQKKALPAQETAAAVQTEEISEEASASEETTASEGTAASEGSAPSEETAASEGAATQASPSEQSAAPETAGSAAGQEESHAQAPGKETARPEPAPKKKKEGPPVTDKIQTKLKNLQEKAEQIRIKKDKVMQIIDNEKNQRWLCKVLMRLKRLLIALLPQIDRLYLHFGFKDPSRTGQTLGMLSMLYPVCEDRMILDPEFDRTIMEGDAACKGHIRLIRFVLFAIPSFVNPQFFKLIKQIKKI